MTNPIAILLGLIIILVVSVDLVFGLGGTMIVMRGMIELIREVAFWR